MVLIKSLSSYKNASLQYDGALHLLTVTYPLIKDPKLLVGIASNIYTSMQYAMDAIMIHDLELKLISPYPSNPESKFNLFRLKCVNRNKIPSSIIVKMLDLREILDLHKKSSTEFQRGESLVISNGDYNLKILGIVEIKEYLQRNKEFLEITNKIINKYN